MLAKLLGGVGRSLMTAGTLILLFVAYQLWGTGLQEAQAQKGLRTEFAEVLGETGAMRTSTTTSAPPATTSTTLAPGTIGTVPVTPEAPVAPVDGWLPTIGEPMAEIKIPAIGITRTVVEGISVDELKRGVGHYPTSPLPGQKGNVAMAGHRTTYGQPFHNVDKLHPGDQIFFKTVQGDFVYKVTGVEIVGPKDVEILDDKGDNRLTLIACHPKYSLKQRIIVHAELEGRPAPPIKGQDKVREKAAKAGADDPFAGAAIDGGLSGQSQHRTPAVLWGLACILIWLATWLVQTVLRRRLRARLARSTADDPAAVAPSTASVASTDGADRFHDDDDLFTDPAAPLPARDRTPTPATGTLAVAARPTRRQRLGTWTPYLIGFPAFLVALYCFFENFSLLLPGNY